MNLQKEWVEKIRYAKKAKATWEEEFKVKMARAYFEGKQNPGYPADEWITINKVYTHVQSQVPTLYSLDPYFYVKIKRSYKPSPEYINECEGKAKIRQSYLNYLKEEVGLKPKVRMAILDAHFSFGVAKTYFYSDESVHPNKGETITDEKGNVLTDSTTGEPLVYPDTIPINKRYVVDWVDSDDFLWDEDSGPLPSSWKWVAQRVRSTRQDAKRNKNYSSKVIDSINERVPEDKGIIKAVADFVKGKDRKKTENETIEYWEVYDIKNKKMLVVNEDAEDLIMAPDDLPKGMEAHPFSILTFVKRTKSPYPIPPVFPGLDPCKELNLARSRIMTHRKRFNRKYEVVVSKLEDESEVSKLESGDDGTIIRVMAQGAVYPITDAPLDQQNYLEISHLNNDIVETLGSPDAARGISQSESATEASIIDKRLEVREGDRMSMVVDFVLDIAKKLDMLVQTHIDKDEAVKITGPQGEYWAHVREEDYQDIEGEFEYSVNVGATQPRLPEIERSQWIAFMSQVIIPFPHVLTSPSFMKKMGELFHIDDENALEELRQIGLKMMSGQMPMPGGGGGSQPSENNPAAAVIGQAMGALGGNNNGGGA